MIEAIRISRPDREETYLVELGESPHTRRQFRSLEEMSRWLRLPGVINWIAVHFRTTAGKVYVAVVEYDPSAS